MYVLKSLCNPYDSTRIRMCHCCYRSEYRRPCCNLPIEEILGWILICLLIFWLYNIIKLCLTIGLMIFILYNFYRYVPIRQLIEKFAEKLNESDELLSERIQSFVQHFISKPKKINEDTIVRFNRISS